MSTSCQECGQKFSRSYNMMRHMKRKHPVLTQNGEGHPRSLSRQHQSLPSQQSSRLCRLHHPSMPFRFLHPFTLVTSGPTSCGKTYFVKRLLQDRVISPPPQRIIWLYKRWQPLYDVIKDTVTPSVEFVRGIPPNLESDQFLDPAVNNVIVLDDLASLTSKDSSITDLFTEGSHHRNLSVIAINQNLYHSKDPTQRRNCHYLCLFKSPVDKSQVTTLGRQMYPNNVQYFTKTFEESTDKPYGYLLIDLKPNTPETLRLRPNVLEDESSNTSRVESTTGCNVRNVDEPPEGATVSPRKESIKGDGTSPVHHYGSGPPVERIYRKDASVSPRNVSIKEDKTSPVRPYGSGPPGERIYRKDSPVSPRNETIKRDESVDHYGSGSRDERMYWEDSTEDMPSCDYCGVVFDSIHDVQKHVKTWCPEDDSHSVLKRKRDDDDETKEAKRKNVVWLHYKTNREEREEKQTENAEEENENEALWNMMNLARQDNESIREEKVQKYRNEGWTEERARIKVDEKMRDVDMKKFFDRYATFIKTYLEVNNGPIHEAIMENVSDLIDEGYKVGKAIRMGLRKNKLTLEGLLQDNSDDSEQDSDGDEGNGDDDDGDDDDGDDDDGGDDGEDDDEETEDESR